jgi:ectoine hydroxylase-related dioxygenase (phytanoyl-CoA dioxygenase family)
VHQDYAVSGVQDMLTTWVPLMEIPVRLGGLAIRPGSHLGPPQRPRVLGQDERGWATAHYQPGDALVFHCLTSHAALPNHGTSLRLSGDFRWQRPDQPAPAQLVLGPAGRRRELFSRLFAREPWWEPVPAGLALSPRESLATVPPGPSRYFAVHPRWRHWQPPGGAVH